MLAEALEDIVALTLGDFAFHFVKREMDDVVMMNFLARQFFAKLKPQLVQQIDFFWREPRSVRAEIENLLPGRRA